MTYTEQIIQKMIEVGYFNDPSYYIESGELVLIRSKDGAITARIPIEKVFLDPKAWRALGKAMGWDMLEDGRNWDSVKYGFIPVWQHYFHGLVDHLIIGGTIESYCKDLIEG